MIGKPQRAAHGFELVDRGFEHVAEKRIQGESLVRMSTDLINMAD